MQKVLNFQQKNPLYCAQDLREYIGYIIEDVVSDEYDCNAKLVLRDKKTNKKVVFDVEGALDGETVFVLKEGRQDD